MRTISTFLLLLATAYASAQTEKTPEGVDLLKAPASPSAQLLNIAPNAIERPTDLSSFWISVNNVTSNFTKFPTDYSFDISPVSLFHSTGVTLKDLNTKNLSSVLWQTLIVSTGIRSVEDTLTGQSFYKAAIGLKISFIRPKWSGATESKYQAISVLQEEVTEKIKIDVNEILKDSLYQRKLTEREAVKNKKSAEYKRIDKELDDLFLILLANKRVERMADRSESYTRLKELARDFKIERVGFYLDMAGGFSGSFPTNKLGYSLADRSGVWLTGGYDGGNNHLSVLGLARYLYQPETIYADPAHTIPTKRISTLDMGTRLLYSGTDDKFNFSLESIYRSVLNKNIIGPSWRLIFSAEYDTGFNTKLTLNLGRDFDGSLIKGGNLIAGLTFIAGFGNKRNL